MGRVGGVGEGEGDGLAVEDAEDAAERANPEERAGAPAHGFGPGEAADQRGDGGGDQCFGRGGGGLFLEHPEIALGGELVPGGAVFAEETGQGGFGRAGAGAAFAGGLGGALGGDGHRDGDPAGAGEGDGVRGAQRG